MSILIKGEGKGRKKRMSRKIDTRIPPYLRPRPAHWPKDYYAGEYFSEIIPEFYQDVSQCVESYSSPWTRRWLIENDKLLKAQRDEDADDCLLAAIDARADMRDFFKQEKLDRREAAVEVGTCDSDYIGTCKDNCRGEGEGGACNQCSGQVVKAGGTIYTKQKSRHTDSGGVRSSRSKSNHVYSGGNLAW